ncbi:metal ABC transporter permease [Streptomyces sp. NPDC002787]
MPRAAGLPVMRLDLILCTVVTATIAMPLEAVGNILALSLLITPAAAARMPALFALTWCLAPRHGLVARARRRRGDSETWRSAQEEAVSTDRNLLTTGSIFI